MSGYKIGVLAHTHPSVTRGGAEISAYTLYTGLRQLGYDAVFIAACSTEDRGKVLARTENEYIVTYEPKAYDVFYHIAPPDTVDQVEALAKKLGCQLLIFHHFLFFGVNTLRRMSDIGLEVFLTFHEFLAMCHNHGQMITTQDKRLCRESHPVMCAQCFPSSGASQFAVRRQFILESLQGISAFISPSRFLLDRFIAWGFPPERFFLIENGLANPTHAAQKTTSATALPKRNVGRRSDPTADVTPLVVGFFGQLNPFKGLDVILDAAERLTNQPPPRPIQFRVHGNLVSLDQTVLTRLEASITSGAIDYRGPYENADVGLLMSECDYILMASRWWENSPVVIQEAFACARPLIVPGIGGMAEKVLDGVNGFHFKPADSADLVRVVRHAAAIDTPTFTFPNPFSAQDMARSYLELSHHAAAPKDIPIVKAKRPRTRAEPNRASR